MMLLWSNKSDKKKALSITKRLNQKHNSKGLKQKELSVSVDNDLGSLLWSKKIDILTHKYSKRPFQIPSLEPCNSSK